MSAVQAPARLATAFAAPRLAPVALVALRRSVGGWGFVALVAIELANAFARDRVWAIEWQWTAYWSNTATFLVTPLAAALAAGESVRYRRGGAGDLAVLGRGRLRGQLGRVSATAGWVLLAHVVGVVACAASAAHLHGEWWPPSLPLLPVLPAFAALIGAVSAGAALGWAWPSLAAPPLVAVLGAGMLTVVNLGRLDWFLRVDNATYSLTGLVTRWEFTVASVAWWLAVALVGGRTLVRRGPPGMTDAVVAALLLVAAVGVEVESDHMLVVIPRPIALVCSGDRPQLCVSRDYRPRLSRYAEMLDRMAPVLRRLDSSAVPDRFVAAGQRVAGSPPVAGVGVISLAPAGPVNVANLALDLAKTASGCADAPYRGSGPLWTAELQVVGWLLSQTGAVEDEFPVATPKSLDQARSALAGARSAC